MRSFVRSALAAALFLAVASFLAIAAPAAVAAEIVSVEEAHERALAGEMALVDIRTPGEWRETGVPAGALAITMHEPGFAARLSEALEGRKDRPIGLICATGGRSAFVSEFLQENGYSSVIDVSEGMHGSSRGAGWLAKGLPVRAPEAERSPADGE